MLCHRKVHKKVKDCHWNCVSTVREQCETSRLNGEQCSIENMVICVPRLIVMGDLTKMANWLFSVLPGGPLAPLCPLIPFPGDPLSPLSPAKPTWTREKRKNHFHTNRACFLKNPQYLEMSRNLYRACMKHEEIQGLIIFVNANLNQNTLFIPLMLDHHYRLQSLHHHDHTGFNVHVYLGSEVYLPKINFYLPLYTFSNAI